MQQAVKETIFHRITIRKPFACKKMNQEKIFDELLKNLTSAGDHQKPSACQ